MEQWADEADDEIERRAQLICQGLGGFLRTTMGGQSPQIKARVLVVLLEQLLKQWYVLLCHQGDADHAQAVLKAFVDTLLDSFDEQR
jgi:hypothetical protein